MALSMQELFNGMAATFKAQAAGNLRATIQFVITGEEAGAHHLVIENGTCTYHAGQAASPTLTITTPDTVWRDIADGKLDGAKALMTGKFKVAGDMGLLMRLTSLFGSAPGR